MSGFDVEPLELYGVVHKFVLMGAGSSIYPLMALIESPKGDATALLTQDDIDSMAEYLDGFRSDRFEEPCTCGGQRVHQKHGEDCFL